MIREDKPTAAAAMPSTKKTASSRIRKSDFSRYLFQKIQVLTGMDERLYFCVFRNGHQIIRGDAEIRRLALLFPELRCTEIQFPHEIAVDFAISSIHIPITQNWTFCDGSYSRWAFICNGQARSGETSEPRNSLISEMCAVYMAICFAMYYNMKHVTVITDCQRAIELLTIPESEHKIAPLRSKRKQAAVTRYVELIRRQMKEIGILLFHVEAHSGIYWNETVDSLTRSPSGDSGRF